MNQLKMRNCRLPLLMAALFLGALAPGLSLAQLTVAGGTTYTEPGPGPVLYPYGIIGDVTGFGIYNNQQYSVTFTNYPGTGLSLGSASGGGTGAINLNTAGPGTGSIAVSANEIIGDAANGSFTQGGGSHTVTLILTLGNSAGVTGTYNLSGGTNAVGGLLLGASPTSTGIYNLSGTGSLSTLFEVVGSSGTGTFTQSGGTNMMGDYLNVGDGTTGNGTYNQTGGSVSASYESISSPGTATFNQSGGTNSVTNDFIVSGSGTCIYNLSASGILSAGNEYIGGYTSVFFGGNIGAFTQSGGTNTVGGLYLGASSGASGAYNLSGTGSLSAANEYVGYAGAGTFTQSGGSNTATTLILAANAGSTGIYDLQGGSLLAGTVNLNTGGTFNQLVPATLNATIFNQQGGTVTGSLQNFEGGTFNYFSGPFSGGLRNYGTVNIGPSNTSGTTLNMGGDYHQYGTGLLDIKIFSATDYDKIVSSTATLDKGGLVVPMLMGGYRPMVNTDFQIVTAGSPISGYGLLTPYPANRVDGSLTLFWSPENTNPNTFDLVVRRNYADPALNLNFKQFAVATMLNSVAITASGDLNNVLNVVDALPTASALGNALQQISPDKAQALSDLSITAVRAETQSLSRRMTNLRYDIDDLGGAGGAGSYVLNGWSVFVDPSGFAGTRSTTMDRTGYDLSGEGFTMGMDRKVADNLLVGLATGYTHATASFSGSGGSADLDLVPISLYAAYMPQSFYIVGTAGYALNLYDLDRLISFSSPGGSVSRAASSSPMGNLFNVYGEAGYDVKIKPLVVTPIVSMGYSHLGIDSFTESGAGSLDLNVSSQSIDSAQSGIGVKIAAPSASGGMKVVPQAFATWQHEFYYGKQDINASLINTPGASTFGWETEGGNRNFANVGGDLSMFVRKDLSVHFSYNAEVGGGGDITHIFSAGVRWLF